MSFVFSALVDWIGRLVFVFSMFLLFYVLIVLFFRLAASTTSPAPKPIEDASIKKPSLTDLAIWTSKTASQRKHKIDETLHSYRFFFGSMLDDKNLQKLLLVRKGTDI